MNPYLLSQKMTTDEIIARARSMERQGLYKERARFLLEALKPNILGMSEMPRPRSPPSQRSPRSPISFLPTAPPMRPMPPMPPMPPMNSNSTDEIIAKARSMERQGLYEERTRFLLDALKPNIRGRPVSPILPMLPDPYALRMTPRPRSPIPTVPPMPPMPPMPPLSGMESVDVESLPPFDPSDPYIETKTGKLIYHPYALRMTPNVPPMPHIEPTDEELNNELIKRFTSAALPSVATRPFAPSAPSAIDRVNTPLNPPSGTDIIIPINGLTGPPASVPPIVPIVPSVPSASGNGMSLDPAPKSRFKIGNTVTCQVAGFRNPETFTVKRKSIAPNGNIILHSTLSESGGNVFWENYCKLTK